MARSTPYFTSGSIATGSTALDEFILEIRNQVGSFLSNGQQAWEIYTGTVELPYTGSVANTRLTWLHSVGDRSLGSGENVGDTDIWTCFHQNGAIAAGSGNIGFSAVQDYSPVNGQAQNFSNSSASSGIALSMSNGIVWYAVFNEYEVTFIFRTAEIYRMFSFGKLLPRTNQKFLGAARLTQEVSGTGTLVLSLDRDIRGTGSQTECQVGQSVWIVNQTYSGSALDTPPKYELAKVVSIASNSITVEGIMTDQTYRSGSLVGLNIQDCYTLTQANTTTTTNLIYGFDFSPSVGNVNADYDNSDTTIAPYQGPAADGFYKGERIYVLHSTYFNGSYRGYLQHLYAISTGTLSNAQRITRDIYGPPDVAENSWLAFTSIRVQNIPQQCVALGPGALDFSYL